MSKRPSKLIAQAGIVCFLAVMGLWLVASGDKAMAEAEPAPSAAKTVTQSMDIPLSLSGAQSSEVNLAAAEGIVRHLSVFIDIESPDASGLKVHLTSPSGTRVLLIDGPIKGAVTPKGLRAWFGADGMQPRQSLAAFAGEPATGRWRLDVRAQSGRLVTWSLAADLSPRTKIAGMETYGEYGESGCDCRVGTSVDGTRGVLGLILLGLALLLRRR